MKRLLEIILVTLVLACTQIETNSTPTNLLSEWRFVGFGNERINKPWQYNYNALNERVTFVAVDKLSGKSSVNRFNAQFKASVTKPASDSLTQGKMGIGLLASTEMAGSVAQNKAEKEYYEFLKDVDGYQITANQGGYDLKLLQAGRSEYLYFVRR